MTRFRFKLDPVIRLRQRRDDDAQRALALAERRVQEATQRLVDADTKLAGAYAQAARAEREGADVVTLGWHRNWIAAKTRDVEARRLEVQERQDVRDVAAREAREARIALRVLERLRDRQRAAFDAVQAHREMQAIDELATMKAARRLGETT